MAHAEEEEIPEDEQRESRLLGYTAEDDPVLGKPKSQKGKAPHHQMGIDILGRGALPLGALSRLVLCS